MIFDFKAFSRYVKAVYEDVTVPYTLEQVLSVFEYYFQVYEAHMGRAHPNIKKDQIRRIIQVMPYVSADDMGACYADIEPEEYRVLIHRHFHTKYRSCDFNVNHFFSGRVRELRWYETCY